MAGWLPRGLPYEETTIPRVHAFLKSLRFWRYRALYLALVKEHAAAGYDVQKNHESARRANVELVRLWGILAPYGARILRGQDEETDDPVCLPSLEYEMVSAALQSGARVTTRQDVGFVQLRYRQRAIVRVD